ncbi:MAG: GDSL-type esterase/lipase family protein [Acidobacteriota bacterium]
MSLVPGGNATPWRQRARATAINLAVALLSIGVFLAVVEIGLRLNGFSYVLYPEDIEFGMPDPQLMKIGFLPDDDLFWVTPDYPDKLARLRTERPRLIFMGDSCTQLGHYDSELAARVANRGGGVLSYGNLGVAGWSSYQGRRQLERDVLELEPAVVTIYYGWNDHWIGFGIADKNVARVRRVFSTRWSGLRTTQLVTKATVAMGARQTAYPNRVALEDFEDNLRTMVRTARTRGIQPMLVTAGSSHTPGQEPEELASRWLRDLSELVPLHQSYVEAVRRVAGQEQALLCDAAAQFAALPRAELETAFTADGIHLTADGDRHLAAMLYACFERDGLLDLVTKPAS